MNNKNTMSAAYGTESSYSTAPTTPLYKQWFTDTVLGALVPADGTLKVLADLESKLQRHHVECIAFTFENPYTSADDVAKHLITLHENEFNMAHELSDADMPDLDYFDFTYTKIADYVAAGERIYNCLESVLAGFDADGDLAR